MHGLYGIDYFITVREEEKVYSSSASFLQVIDTADKFEKGYKTDELSFYFKSLYLYVACICRES